ncbi:SMP-30/gluconolactonase/LRE family protein (plasmid) [Rhodococcoides fascians]|uniref:SMP-30/gluconolactonase/LRE family protein n=1 Tax=Rhodococcoides fascians TaxID=1828 RepID=UPI00389A4999
MALGLVHRWDGRSATTSVVAEIPGSPAGLGWLPDGSMLVVSMDGRCIYRVAEDGSTTVHADLAEYCAGKANELLVTSKGHAYVGSFGFDYHGHVRRHSNASLFTPPGPPAARLIHISPSGEILDTSSPLLFPNGCVTVDSESTLVVAETLGLRLTSFPLDETGAFGPSQLYTPLVSKLLWVMLTGSGALGRTARALSTLFDSPRFARYQSSPIGPDGIASGPGRQIWVANALRGECVLVDPNGPVRRRVKTSQSTLSCVTGGSDGRTLFAGTSPTSDPVASAELRQGRIERAYL